MLTGCHHGTAAFKQLLPEPYTLRPRPDSSQPDESLLQSTHGPTNQVNVARDP
ncbi:hypothetical protein BH20CHL3_BH20CHL3_03460 [soil metagenome]